VKVVKKVEKALKEDEKTHKEEAKVQSKLEDEVMKEEN
jgi:hypothetical protein